MMRQRRRWPAAVAGLLLIATAGAAVAFGGPHGHRPDRGGMSDSSGSMPLSGAYRLEDLTDAQRDKLDALRDRIREEQRQRRDAGRDDRRALRNAFRDGADVKAVRPLAERQGERVEEMILARAQVRSELAGILTEAQRQALREGGAGCRKRRW